MTWYNWVGWIGLLVLVLLGVPAIAALPDAPRYFWDTFIAVLGVELAVFAFLGLVLGLVYLAMA